MNWRETAKEKPPFNQSVWAWSECEKCRDKIPHAHNCLARLYPVHGGYVAIYNPPDPFAVDWARKRGDSSYDYLLEPSWTPAEPKYWVAIESPYE